jgi:ABC-type Co2+ transport system permease subunit
VLPKMALAAVAVAALVGALIFRMSPTVYYILHVFSVLVLTGYTFYAFAAPAEKRKQVMMITGIASLLALVGGFGLLTKLYNNQFSAWVIVKIVCWLGLSALAGIGFRKRAQAPVFMAVVLALAFAAIFAVYTKLAF